MFRFRHEHDFWWTIVKVRFGNSYRRKVFVFDDKQFDTMIRNYRAGKCYITVKGLERYCKGSMWYYKRYNYARLSDPGNLGMWRKFTWSM